MKKKIVYIITAVILTAGICMGCGSDDTAVISKDDQTAQTESQATEPEQKNSAEATPEAAVDGYVLITEDTIMAPDMDMAPVLESLGEPVSYYEAPSCAFEGLDKVYTYDNFEIDTYPDGENDKIAAIILKNDMVETSEGIAIGDTLADIEAAYGSDYEVESGMVVLTKGDMDLKFIVTNDAVTSIEYDSKAGDAQ
ncbi:MAG: hypothetical protein PHP50_00910 [Lachnospiraceae bacterium]|nr:hypothetical protein [Lachnospiraceae bacterium]